MYTEIVAPDNNRREGVFFLLTFVIVLAIFGLLIMSNQRADTSKDLFDYQIDANSSLNEKELTIYNALYSAGYEISMYYEILEGIWPSVGILTDEFVAPFARDMAWETSGKFEWEILYGDQEGEQNAFAVYRGQSDDPDINGNFLLIMFSNKATIVESHKHNMDAMFLHFEIWYNNTKRSKEQTTFTNNSLIAGGWKMVLPYIGEEEVDRLKGEDL